MRLFLGFHLDSQLKASLKTIAEELTSKLDLRTKKLIRWQNDLQLHLTVKFLGEVSDELLVQVEDNIREALNINQPFVISFDGLGCFPERGKARIFWLGVKDGVEQLQTIFNRLEASLEQLGIKKEERLFSPHATIARIAAPGADRKLRTILSQGCIEPYQQTVDRMILFRSTLCPTGADYSVVREFIFNSIP